jgi:hypothetical protein
MTSRAVAHPASIMGGPRCSVRESGTGLCLGSGSNRAPKRKHDVAMTCSNAVEAQDRTPRPDTTYNCASDGRLTIAVDMPVR